MGRFYFRLIAFIPLLKFSESDDVFTNRFSEIRFTPSFVDKTRLIYEVLKHKHLFINAPRHFGKSVNTGMLNMFLSNLRTKETLEEYFNGTKIWDSEEFVKEHLGSHPVILYNASANCVVHDEDHMTVTVLWTLFTTFSDHAYLLHSQHVSDEDLEKLRVFLDEKKIQRLKLQEARQALTFLARLLYRHHGKQVILLADDFGCGTMERLLEDNLDLRYLTTLAVDWYGSVISNILKSQDLISHAVFSGETWLHRLTDLNTFHRSPFMESKALMPFNGFTYTELKRLFDDFSVEEEQRTDVIQWYCGYSSADGEFKVCNPHSVLQFLNSPYKNIKSYWIGSTVGAELLQKIAEKDYYRKHLVDLANGRPINISVGASVEEEAVTQLRRKVEDLQWDSELFISRVLLEVGYLTFSGHQETGTLSLKLPNKEIKSIVEKFTSLPSFI
uniref:AAA-ATPase-like domain-containing protein n=1 Tax=Graphocephala atropunctata TaxID=36148 RepID=A0A1B6M5H8_9HEMI